MNRIFRLACSLLVLFPATSYAQSNALSFAGDDRYVTVPHNNLMNVTNAFTVEAWIKTNSGTARQVIAAKMFPTTDTWLFELQPAGGGVKLNLYTHTGSGNDHLSTSLIPANTWCHVAATYDGAQVRFYVNGVADGVLVQGGNISSNTQPLRIGAWGAAWGGGDERRFNGLIDELRLWNTTRSAAEIKAAMYGSVPGNATGLIACYQMNEGSGQTVADISANHLNGILGADNTAANDPAWTSSPLVSSSNSLNFDSNNDYLLVSYNAAHDITNALTMEAWIYPTDNGWSNILMKGNYGYGFALSGNGGSGSCGTPNTLVFWDQSGCGTTIRSTVAYTLNVWQHVAVTIEDIGSQLRIYFYLNGTADGPYYSNAASISNGGSNQDLYVGTQGSTCPCNYFEGSIDELRIWNSVRSSADIAANRNATLTGTESGLVLLYTFNQGITSGDNTGLSIAIDATGNNLHGRLANFSLSGSNSNWIAQRTKTLPVQLLNFTAGKSPVGIELQWSTAQEQNSSHFNVERSTDALKFEKIGTVAAGNSSRQSNYTFTDAAPLPGNNYYRLQQVDRDNRFTYSSVVTGSISPSSTTIGLRSNPVTDRLNPIITANVAGQVKFVITNTAGITLVNTTAQVRAGTTHLEIPLQGIGAGVYYLQATYNNRTEVIMFVKR